MPPRSARSSTQVYATQTVIDGADSMIVRRTTYAPPKDVVSGYIRLPWATLYREAATLTASTSSTARD